MWAVFTACALLGVLAFFPPFWVMVVVSFAVGLLYGPVNPIGNLAMQVLTPEQLRGRVVGIITSTAYAAGPLGLLIAGPLVQWQGVRTAALVFAALIIAAAAAGFLMPGLRRLDDLDVRLAVPSDTEPGESAPDASGP